MTGGEILDMGLRVYQMLGANFLRLAALPSVFCLAGIAFVGTYVLPSLFWTNNPDSIAHQFGEVAWALGLAVGVGGPLFLLGLSYITTAVTLLTSDYMVGNVPNLEAAERTSLRMLGRLFVVTLRELLISLSGVLISLGIMIGGALLKQVTPSTDATAGILVLMGGLGLVAGFFVFLFVIAGHALAAPAAVLEDLSPSQASRRSKELLRAVPFHGSGTGTLWSLYLLIGFAMLVLLGGIYGSFGILQVEQNVERLTDGFPLQSLILGALNLLPWFLIVWTLVPMWAATVTILYYERRIRLEGYDIEALAQDIARSDRASRFQL